MRKIRYKKKYVLGLFAYLIQIERSIVRMNSVEELSNFFSDKTQAYEVIRTMQQNGEIQANSNLYPLPSEISFWNAVKLLIKRLSSVDIFLDPEEAGYIKYLLKKFFRLLNGEIEEMGVPQLRYEITKCAYNIVGRKLSPRKVKLVMRIEHLNQSPFIEHFTLEELVDENWPNIS